jgi:hypothetical protein
MDKMMKITDEMIAAFLDGNATISEIAAIVEAARKDRRFREYLAVVSPDSDVIPVSAQAAKGGQDNLCDILCEQYVLQKFGITISEDELVGKARKADWLREGGMPLFRIGSLCSEYGLSVTRRYKAAIEDIQTAWKEGYEVIAAVDGGELDGVPEAEALEDEYVGRIPDHAVVVLDISEDSVYCFDPLYGSEPHIVPLDVFLNAWDDSESYMVKVASKETVAHSYRPAPLDLSDVRLPESLTELTEAIAENTHELWSQSRLREGWTYGAVRDDAQLKHPDLLPYSDLPEGEKEYDRTTAMNAIKLIVKLGYRIDKIK